MEEGEERTQQIALTGKRLARVSSIPSDKFEIVFDGNKIECNRFQAAFISDAICRVFCANSSVDRFEVTGYSGDPAVCEQLSRLMNGSAIVINENNCKDLEALCRILENDELLDQIIEFRIGKEDLCISNCISRLKAKQELGSNIHEELEFIACSFHEFDSDYFEKLRALDLETLERILSSENLCLNDEDTLVEFISSLGQEYSSLYNCVECQYLTRSGIEMLLSFLSLEQINYAGWDSICRRLRIEVPRTNVLGKRFKGGGSIYKQHTILDLPYSEGKPFEGIINYLTVECDGNVHEKGIVTITTSDAESNLPRSIGEEFRENDFVKLVEYGERKSWFSKNLPNSWVCFDFREKSVSVSSYTISSGLNWAGYPLKWELEGSTDGQQWKLIDRRETQDLGQDYAIGTFECSESEEFFRFVRLRQTGKDSLDCDSLRLSGVEFFGVLRK
jgi:hypothetical protein